MADRLFNTPRAMEVHSFSRCAMCRLASPGRLPWGFAASTPFIGAGKKNFSHGRKNLFETVCPGRGQRCPERGQWLIRLGAQADRNRVRSCLDLKQEEWVPGMPAAL